MPSTQKNGGDKREAANDKFIVTPPAPALPKGGGAIKGIGEKFTANPVTGTGGLTVPIFTTPSRADFFPQLSLSYDSGEGNGPFGLGWNLSIPSIARKTEKGLPQYRDEVDSDVFILSGSEELVPALKKDVWTEDVFEDAGFNVRRYRPRTEQRFTRVERLENIADGVVHWRTITADNITSVFGKSPECRISDPDDDSRVFKWLIEESFDAKGNLISYEYKQENKQNIDASAPQEKTRLGSKKLANRYLKRINYGNKTKHQHDWLFHVVFDYGEHDIDEPSLEDAGEWPSRPDAFSTYRAGFEVRTYRLCRRVLMFHNFPELGEAPRLVRSTDFLYAANPVASFLSSVTQSGYLREQVDGPYLKQSLPPVEFAYTEAKVDEEIHFVEDESLENLPVGIDGQQYQWVDLESEGLPGILTEQAHAWFYKRNLGGGRFAPTDLVISKPVVGNLDDGQQQLVDLTGGGSKYLFSYSKPLPGYHQRTADGGWENFIPFSSLPNISWDDRSVRFIDLTGDGFADILITEENAFVWCPSLCKEGFGPSQLIRTLDEDGHRPTLIFNDRSQAVFLADMKGDGLTDIVRIRNGEICYWPNLGYGHFGAKVTMDAAPTFDHPDQFDQKRIRLGDIDGSGTTDIIYLGGSTITFWINQSGNSWSTPRHLTDFPATDNLASVIVVDLLGNGTSCLVWSSPSPAHAHRPLRYIDLMSGQKPHLLASVKNNMGRETRLRYVPSTKFYLEDRAAGTPWITKLPFPVQVVERVETRDEVTGAKLVNLYRYHHGYYDGEEREFRGFGLVEQWDTESFSGFKGLGLFSTTPPAVEEGLHAPPVYTRTWFHTGAYQKSQRISKQFASEYYQGDASAALLPDTILPGGLTAAEEREACRALKGRVLRQEVYALDETPQSVHPYSVSEGNYEIRLVQPVKGNEHAVFFVHEREGVTYYYERNPDGVADPRVAHQMVLGVDEYGNVTESATISYPRRTGSPSIVPFDEQLKTAIVYTESDFINKAEETAFYRLGVPSETRTYELTGIPPDAGWMFTPSHVLSEASLAQVIQYEEKADAGVPPARQKRLVERARTLYYKDDLSQPLSLSDIESLALPYESYKVAFTPGLIDLAYDGRVTSAMLADEGKYLFEDGVWWIRSGRHVFDAAHFYLPVQVIDPFGKVSTIEYDPYSLLVTKTTDPLTNSIEVKSDYRTMASERITDVNGNRSEVRFDALGMVIATAVRGKQGENVGDTLDEPTTRLEYELFNWMQPTPRPNFVHTFAREQHGPANPRWQESYTYSDGFGREVLVKVQAEPGLAPARDADGELVLDADNKPVLAHTDSRWIGTGRTIFDNKGNPVKQYEPFFSSTHEYEDEADLVEWGVTPILHYDPLGRLIRTDSPNGTVTKVEFGPWKRISWDADDLVTESRWYEDRLALDPTDPANAPEIRAAHLAQQHAGTPTVAHADTLGRTFLTIVDNGPEGTYSTHVELDIEGHQLAWTDARGRQMMVSLYNLVGQELRTQSIDSGTRWLLNNVLDKSMRAWDNLGFTIRTTYDELHRLTHLHFRQGDDPDVLAERMVYGETYAQTEPLDAAARNLRGKLYQHYDGAGAVTNEQYDFKGNLLHGNRRLALEYKQQVDWISLAGLNTAEQIATAADPLLEAESFIVHTAFDALNRAVSMTMPDDSEVLPTYNEANLLERVEVRLRGAPAETPFVTNINYNAKGQRELIQYGSGVHTTYFYDPLTFHLAGLKSVRSGDNVVLQNLSYTYSPVGHVVEVRDEAQQTVFFNNAVVSPGAQYEYDALYRLTKVSGREHVGQAAHPQPDHDDGPRMNHPHPNDGQAMRRYSEQYEYDEVGNILRMIHVANNGNWTRRYKYAPENNRLLSNSLPGDLEDGPYSAVYSYDGLGNMTSMPHLFEMQWDHKNQLRMVDLGGGGKAYYVYDSAGRRMRKVWEKSAALIEERIYLGGYEIFRQRQSGNLKLERETLHIMDDNQKIALVETKTYDETEVASPAPIIRYLHSNHLGSASLELDVAGALISYEEYYPYGSTSYHSAPGGAEVSPNRYRYTGKERDEETRLYYYGRRYYASWLGRWTAADPAGLVDGPNLYHYSQNNPINLIDPNGMQSKPKLEEAIAQMLKESERPTLPPAAAAEEPVVIALGRFKFYGKTGAKMDLTKDVVALAANQTGMEAKIIGQLDVMKSPTDASKVGYDPTQVWNALAPKTPGRPVLTFRGAAGCLIVTPEAPLGMQSAMHVQHVLSGEAKAGGQAVTALHFNTTGIPLFPAVETAGHTEAELRSVLAAVASEQHKVDIYIKEGEQVLKIPAGQSVIEGGPVPARFQKYLPNVVEAKPKPPAPPPPAAAAPLAAERGAAGKGLTVAGLTEGALKVARFGGKVLTLYGAVTQAAETARQSPSGPANKLGLYLVGTALGVAAGVVDDAMAATLVLSPVVLDSWEKKNAGPAQVEVNRLLRAYDQWWYSTF